ncbi:MAG TPA: type II toxin-antitoxin system VapB family antitoxin [Caulobacteraceae bacterium]|nr:type II toxin-antitoxin system VapB family antitoxin [Caulobacteraceae bacterium]
MAFHVHDPKTDALVRPLARQKGVGVTEAVKLAVDEELRREAERPPLSALAGPAMSVFTRRLLRP